MKSHIAAKLLVRLSVISNEVVFPVKWPNTRNCGDIVSWVGGGADGPNIKMEQQCHSRPI